MRGELHTGAQRLGPGVSGGAGRLVLCSRHRRGVPEADGGVVVGGGWQGSQGPHSWAPPAVTQSVFSWPGNTIFCDFEVRWPQELVSWNKLGPENSPCWSGIHGAPSHGWHPSSFQVWAYTGVLGPCCTQDSPLAHEHPECPGSPPSACPLGSSRCPSTGVQALSKCLLSYEPAANEQTGPAGLGLGERRVTRS